MQIPAPNVLKSNYFVITLLLNNFKYHIARSIRDYSYKAAYEKLFRNKKRKIDDSLVHEDIRRYINHLYNRPWIAPVRLISCYNETQCNQPKPIRLSA